MKPCLSFSDVVEVGRPRLNEMERVGNMYPNGDSPEACEAFTHQVVLVEGTVIQTYGMAAAFARKADELGDIAEVWKEASQFCQAALEVLSKLKDKYPYCGTPQLYDVVLDYKSAADKRCRGVMEEAECQKMDFPKGLLPELT